MGAYSLAYPVSVLACLVGVSVLQRGPGVDYTAEARAADLAEHQIDNATATVRRPVTVKEVVRSSPAAHWWSGWYWVPGVVPDHWCGSCPPTSTGRGASPTAMILKILLAQIQLTLL